MANKMTLAQHIRREVDQQRAEKERAALFRAQKDAAWAAKPEGWAFVVKRVREACRLGLQEAVVLANAADWNADAAIKSWTPEAAACIIRAGGRVSEESVELANGVRR